MNKIFTYAFTKKLFLSGLMVFFSVMHVFAQAPVINSFSPASGPVGTTVTINGSGFNATPTNNIVFFGATMATVTAASATTLTVIVPEGSTYEPISILNSNNALIGYSAKPFVATFTPRKGAITKDDFMPPVAFNTGGGVGHIKIADLDGDGKPDLVMLNIVTHAVTVLRNTSTSGFITASSFAPKIEFPLPSGMAADGFAIGDIDGDGKIDVITSSSSAFNDSLTVFRNTSTIGSITFAPRVNFAGRKYGSLIAIGDLDGDGKLDIAMSGNQFGGVSIWRNTSTPGSITVSSLEPRVDIGFNFHLHSLGNSTGIAIGDLDGDGKPEIVAGNFPDSTICVWHNTSTPGSIIDTSSFSPAVRFATAGGADEVIIGDLDGDGKPDIVAASEAIWISVLRNTSTKGTISAGSFAPKVDFRTNGEFVYPVIGDLDGDGKPDILVVNPQTFQPTISYLSIFRNTSTVGSITANSFAPRVIIPAGNWAPAPAIGDLDGDGKADIALTYNNGLSTGNSVVVFRNNPLFPPDIQATNVVFTNTATNSTTVGWTNGDGTARAVFISNTTTGSPLPVQSTTYAANTVYTSGSQIGSSGWYCIYNGTGNTVDITGLSSGATYRVMAVEYNGTLGAENYVTSVANGNPANVTTIAGGSISINSINRVSAQLTNASTVQYNATFAASVTGLSSGDFALVTTGSVGGPSITSLTGSGSSYTINVNTGTGDGTIGLNLSNGSGLTPAIITRLPFAGQTYILDRTPPSITISTPSDSLILSGTSKKVTFKVTYADSNFNTSTLSASNVTLNHTGSATGTVNVSGSDTTYTITIANITGSGSLGISIGAGTASDLAGNTASAKGPSKTFLIAPVLSGLTASSGTLSPVFADTTMNYTAVVNNAVNTITITPTLTDPNATVTVNGTSPSTPVNLAVGLNTIQIKVTPLDGTTTTIYTVGIVRAAPAITGKAPDISYDNGNITITSNQPFSVTPTNKGGPVPQSHYGQVTIFAGSPSETAGYINATGTAAVFNNTQQTVMDGAGNLYVTDAYNNAIRMITPSGVVSTFAGSATGLNGFTDGTGTAAGFNFPDGITIDASGNLYVSDYNNNAIRKISPLGGVTTFYHTTNAFGPGGMCIDTSGNIIVAAQDASQVIKITPTGVATVLAGSTMGYTSGTSLTAQFNTPGDVQPDTLGNLYVADFNNSAIRKITPAGQVITIAGSDAPTVTSGFADGVGTASLFNYPPGLYVAPGGVVYVADLLNNDIRRIMPDGTVNLIAGNAGQTPGDADGIGTAAQFNLPAYIYIDGTGTGYVSEIGGNRVRKLVLTGYTLKGTLPAGLAFDPTTGVISGTPTIPFATTTDTVTAFNAFGYSATIFHINYQPPSTIATLSNLVPGSGTLAPVFTSSTTNYSVNEPNAASSITVTPTATDSTATIKVNGVAATSGTASASIPLTIGSNTITIVVTAQDSVTTDTYTVIVNRAALSAVATLNDLTISNGTLTPSFASGTINYSAIVANNISSITVTPTATDASATIQVNGVPVSSGSASAAIPLVIGPNTITTIVTAQDGTTIDTYTVVVTRAASSNSTLINLTVSQGTLTPSFSSGTFAYTDNVPNSTASITITPTSSDNTATITVNGSAVVSGTASAAIQLAIGPNTFTTVVTAQDGTTTDTYTVIVTRAADAIASLTNLTVSQGTLTPSFSSGTFAYTDNVPNATTSVTVTPTVSDHAATVTVNGKIVASGTASGSISLTVGPNAITTVVTAEDGTTTDTYTIVVTRAANTDASLSNLTVNEGTLAPAFNSNTTAYTDTVSNLVYTINVTLTTSDQNATITVNGASTTNGSPVTVGLTAGENTITVIVTAQDGTTTNTYTITVYKGESMGSIDATNVLTPNGDGKNDYWLIKDIELYPQNNVTVYDKAGRVVYTKHGYNNEWDGTLNGSPLAEGTYYFVVDLGPNLRKFKGYVSILRN